jgi:hypothetical protein
MPKTTNESRLDRTLQDIVERAAAQVALAVRQNIADEVTRLVGVTGSGGVAKRMLRKRRVIFCPVPNCGKPGGGPKWGWFCADHKDLPAAEKEKARAATRARTGAAANRRRGRRKK